MLKLRNISLAVLLIFIASPVLASTINYQDWWWNPSQSGRGVNIGQQGNTLFASWFDYDPATGAGMFLTVAGNILNNKVTGDLIRTTGPALGTPFNPALVTRTVVGQATLTFSDANTGTLQYTVNSISGTVALSRFTFASLNPAGEYIGGLAAVRSGCQLPANNGEFFDFAAYDISTNNNSLNIQEVTVVGQGSCSYAGTYAQNGSKISASGPFTCSGGTAGTWSSKEILVLDGAFTASNVNLEFTTNETCQATVTWSGSKAN